MIRNGVGFITFGINGIGFLNMKEVLFGFGIEKNWKIVGGQIDIGIGDFEGAAELIGGGEFVENDVFFEAIA